MFRHEQRKRDREISIYIFQICAMINPVRLYYDLDYIMFYCFISNIKNDENQHEFYWQKRNNICLLIENSNKYLKKKYISDFDNLFIKFITIINYQNYHTE